MQNLQSLMIEKAKQLLNEGKVDRVIGWVKGETYYDNSPCIFDLKNINNLVYNSFCGANLSKYLVAGSKKGGKMLVFLKPCDTYSFNQLLSEHRINRDNFYVVAVECQGMLDINKINSLGITGIKSIEESDDSIKISTIYGDKELKKEDSLLIKCETCKSKEFAVFDEKIVLNEMKKANLNRFEEVEKLEKMTEEERYKFWQSQLSKCIRCNACRNVCPACTCTNCVFDNNKSGVAGKSNADSFEEKLYHIIRSFHVVGRCTDCGECSRVCPQSIPLHLINRKYIKDINEFYGEYQAGEKVTGLNPIVDFTKEDIETKDIFGGKK